MKNWLATIGLVSAVAMGVPGVANAADAPNAVRIGTSSVGSDQYILGIAIGEMLTKHVGINATTEPLGGSAANMFGLARDKVELAVGNSGAAYDSMMGRPPYKERQPVRLLVQGHPSFRLTVVRKDAGIKTPADLEGRTIIAQRRSLPELEAIADAMVDVYGLDKSKIRYVSTVNTKQVSDALRVGTVDAAVMPTGPSMPIMSQLFQDDVVEFLYLDQSGLDKMLEKLPAAFSTRTLPKGNFPKQKADLQSLILSAYLVTDTDLSEETAYQITKTVLGNHQEFAKYHSAAKYWTLENTLSDPKVPFHAGAVRYFKEIGVWTPELEAVQQKLLHKAEG